MSRFDVSASDHLAGATSVAARLIREAIVAGRLKPGERLPEAELARELDISRTPIREALRQLQAEGLVDAPRNRGARVRVYTADDLDDMYQLRALLEGFASRRAALRITDDGLTELRAASDRFDALDPVSELDELLHENDRFHAVVVDAAASPLLDGMLRQVTAIPRATYRAYAAFSPEEQRASSEDHHRLISALEHRDGELAELIMRSHVLQARDTALPLARQALEDVAEE
jgi:DNA-binding GntR family transcriptional regulator